MKIIRPLYILAFFILVVVVYPSPAASKENVSKVDGQEIVVVGDINFVIEKEGAERVCFSLSRFCNPAIFSMPGKPPRLVIDVKPVQEWHGKPNIQVNGVQIKQIRAHLHRKEGKLRIVLDLNPSMDFMVEPLYYEDERVYCVDVLKK